MRRNRGILTVVALAMLVISVRGAVSAEHAPAMSAEQALKLLLEGNQRFIAGKMEHPYQTPARRVEVAKGQHPFAAVLACSDSRTGPEVVFDRGLGDIFVVRVAGNVADQVVIESLDYSVKHPRSSSTITTCSLAHPSWQARSAKAYWRAVDSRLCST